MICEDCGAEIEIGSWPFCGPDGHPEARPASAFFDPIVVFKDAQGNYRIPGNSNAKPPKGFEKVEINNRRDANKMLKAMDGKERRKFWEQAERDNAFFNNSLAKNRAETLKMMEGVTDSRIRAFMEHTMREMDKRDRVSYDPGVYLQVLE